MITIIILLYKAIRLTLRISYNITLAFFNIILIPVRLYLGLFK